MAHNSLKKKAFKKYFNYFFCEIFFHRQTRAMVNILVMTKCEALRSLIIKDISVLAGM